MVNRYDNLSRAELIQRINELETILAEVTKEKDSLKEKLFKFSISDSLTNAYNMYFFKIKLFEEIERCKRSSCIFFNNIILLPDTPVDRAVILAEELRKSLSQLDIQGASRVTASFGVVGYCPADNVDALINKADKTMYEAKAAGRNCVRIYV